MPEGEASSFCEPPKIDLLGGVSDVRISDIVDAYAGIGGRISAHPTFM
jgi:hypothetical protein